MTGMLLNTVQNDELIRILNLVNEDEILRMGKLFSTDLNNYFYDTGTGKVILLDDETYYIMNLWFSMESICEEDFLNNHYINYESLLELLGLCINEQLLKSIKATRLYSPYHFENLEQAIDNNLEQLILELTGKCNLRCGYCIYNDNYTHNRDFNHGEMTIEIAKQAVDYFYEHSRNKMAITFYGGEPLLKFDLLKWVINYSLKKNRGQAKEMTFSLTTNLTLVTEEIAEYLANVPGLSILCSIDGPEEIHNSYRKHANGEGSFAAAFRGLKLICDSFKEKKNNYLAINAVFAPPYTYEKLDAIDEFFSNLDFLFDNMKVNITYPTKGSINNEVWINKISKNPKYRSSNYDEINPLWKWQNHKIKNTNNIVNKEYKSIVSSGLDQVLTKINDRYISDVPTETYPINGCCVPGNRRLYVDTKGEFYPCERIGTSPSIGNISSGIDCGKVRHYYVEDYINKSITRCADCWAVRLCGLCYAGRYDESGFNDTEESCEGTKRVTEKYLSYYHELLETDKHKLDFLVDIELS